MPNRIMPTPSMNGPFDSTVASSRPRIISEKYSFGPNCSAVAASGGASAAIASVATQPAKNEPIAAVESATPARPCRAIW